MAEYKKCEFCGNLAHPALRRMSRWYEGYRVTVQVVCCIGCWDGKAEEFGMHMLDALEDFEQGGDDA